MKWFLPSALLTVLLCAASAQTPDVPTRTVKPVLATNPVSQDPDDPAIWINPGNPAQSVVIGTNKIKADEGGALYVFGLDGKTRQIVPNLDRPNNVDVEYGLKLGGKRVDIAVCTERLRHALRVFAISSTGKLTDLLPDGLPVFAGETGAQSEPMGIALYKRPADGEVFAVVGRKSGPAKGYLHLYRLHDDGTGKPVVTFVRAFGAYSGKKEIEAICVDDALGYIYYADETVCIRKYPANPDSPYFGQELASFGREKSRVADHEGLAVYTHSDGTGYVVSTDQIPATNGGTRYYIYKREGTPGDRHDHRAVRIVSGGADETDGVEIVSAPLGEAFPKGLFVAMNSGAKNFLLYDAAKIAPKK